MAISREFVIESFLRYLGRNPESESIVADHMAIESEDKLVRTLTRSKEYFGRAYSNVAFESSARSKFLIIGNCQAVSIATLINAMSSCSSAVAIELTAQNTEGLQTGNLEINILAAECDYIILQHLDSDLFTTRLIELYPCIESKLRYVPGISYTSFHPDMGYVKKNNGTHLGGPMGEYHSMIAFWCWQQGLSKEQAVSLYHPDIYKFLGYYDHGASSDQFLVTRGNQMAFTMEGMLARWKSKGCFMHSLNHPKLSVLADVARQILLDENVSFTPSIETYLIDHLADHPCWPVYPEIARLHNLEGSLLFKQAKHLGTSQRPVPTLSLTQFVSQSFDHYATYDVNSLTAFRLDSDQFKHLKDHLTQTNFFSNNKHALDVLTSGFNPYTKIQSHQLWRRAVEKIESDDVDPVVKSRFSLTRQDKVATAGSCFAQHISKTLSKSGFTYYVPENGEDQGYDAKSLTELNYGVFSARYGNIYTSRQLLQLFDRAYGEFNPLDQAWKSKDGNYVDPFRPLVKPNGYSTVADVVAAREEHLGHVRTMFENVDIFVFTLGLTEAWRRLEDGAVFPLAPGVAAGGMDEQHYEFVNFETHDVIADLEAFISRIQTVNPKCRIILTVSPVPLVATYERRHVLVSTTYSKSALRAAADYITRRHTICDYFPSYEIITGNFNKGSYYEADLRSVRPEGVNHVMRLFMQHYSHVETPKEATSSSAMLREAAQNNAIVCDEEALDSNLE
jgi:hypothetical protein